MSATVLVELDDNVKKGEISFNWKDWAITSQYCCGNLLAITFLCNDGQAEIDANGFIENKKIALFTRAFLQVRYISETTSFSIYFRVEVVPKHLNNIILAYNEYQIKDLTKYHLKPYLVKILSDYSATGTSLYLQECQQKQQRVERYHESKRFNHH